jgi:hypothetical protein
MPVSLSAAAAAAARDRETQLGKDVDVRKLLRGTWNLILKGATTLHYTNPPQPSFISPAVFFSFR